jgi:hypothetical protein
VPYHRRPRGDRHAGLGEVGRLAAVHEEWKHFLVCESSHIAATLWLHEARLIFDSPSDAALALHCAGFIGPRGDRHAERTGVGRQAAARKEWERSQMFLLDIGCELSKTETSGSESSIFMKALSGGCTRAVHFWQGLL